MMVAADPRARRFFHRPWHLRIANAAGGLLSRLGALRYPLTREALSEAAVRATGWDDFGPDDYIEPLERLLAAYRDEARLNFIGEAMAHTYLMQLLRNRLLVERVRSSHPEVASERVEAPVFILGLPRTGSTILYELTALAPEFRAPLTWEIMFADPPGLIPRPERQARRAQAMLGWLDWLAPEFKKIHPMGGALPQECIMILSLAFRSVQFHTQNDVPSYQAWLNDADLAPAYAYHRRFLQHLQAFGAQAGRRWLLKAPAHLFGLDALFETYPDARVIQTHRRPSEVVASVSSFSATIRQAFSEHLDLDELGRTSCALWQRALDDAAQFRARRPELAGRFMDLRYRDFLAAPQAAVAEVSRFAGLSVDDEAESRVRAYLAAHPQNRHGRHEYRLADFGLEAGAVDEMFAGYIERYDL